MGRKGQKSIQVSFKVYTGLKDRMDKEVELSGNTQAGFLNEAVKFYIDYLENKRLETWSMQKEMIESSGDPFATKKLREIERLLHDSGVKAGDPPEARANTGERA